MLDRDGITERVRQAIDEARARGEQPPGRPTLVKLTGATEHQVKVALAKLEAAGDDESPAATSEPPAVTNGHPIAGAPSWNIEDAQPPLATGNGHDPAELETAGGGLANAGDSESPAATRVTSAGDPPVTPDLGLAKFYAWTGFLFGSIVSVLANVLAARIPPHGAAPDWKPQLDSQVGAAVWPLGLLLSVEILSRIPWPDKRLWKFACYLAVGGVATFSAVISYQHIRDVLVSWGYPNLSALVGPLVIDGLMTVSGLALLAIAGGKLAKSATSGSPANDQAGDE